MKHTLLEKIKSIIINLAKAKIKEIYIYWTSKLSDKKKKEFSQIFGGDTTSIEDFDGRDWILGEAGQKELPVLQNDNIYMMDQGRQWRTRNGCVLFSVYTSLCHNLNIKPDFDFLLGLHDKFEREGLWREDEGASIPEITKAMCKYWNELHPDRRVVYYREYRDFEATKKGYRLVGGHSVFPMYISDMRDRRIDFNSYSDMRRRNGHALTVVSGAAMKGKKQIEIRPDKEILRRYTFLSDDLHCINSYPTTFKDINIYEHGRLYEHCDNAIWYSYFYLIVEESSTINNEEERVFTDVQNNSPYINGIKWAKENKIVSGYSDGRLGAKEKLDTDRFLAILHNYHTKMIEGTILDKKKSENE